MSDEYPPFLDTPGGILTASGIHFRTTRALLEDYAGPVLEVVPLATLVDRAEVWLRSGQTLALWVLALLLLVAPPVGAAFAALTLYLGWETLGPSVASPRLVAVFRGWRATALVGLTSMLGSLGWFTAYTLQTAAYVNTVGQVELILSVAASTLFFHEKITAREAAGIVLLMGSIVILILVI